MLHFNHVSLLSATIPNPVSGLPWNTKSIAPPSMAHLFYFPWLLMLRRKGHCWVTGAQGIRTLSEGDQAALFKADCWLFLPDTLWSRGRCPRSPQSHSRGRKTLWCPGRERCDLKILGLFWSQQKQPQCQNSTARILCSSRLLSQN